MRHITLTSMLVLVLCLPAVAQTRSYVIHNGPARTGATTFTAAPTPTPSASASTSHPAASYSARPASASQPYYGDAAYMNAYRRVIRSYNPSLGAGDLESIVCSILYYSDHFRIDPRFVVAVVAHESRFRTNAVSSVGAQGLGQLMPETAASLGVDPRVPYQNIQGTVRYLKLMLSRFTHLDRKNQMRLALASYNAGYGAVTRYGGVPPYAETQNYVNVVMREYVRLSGDR